MNTIAESPYFLKKLAAHLSEAEHDELLDFIAEHPLAGAVIKAMKKVVEAILKEHGA